MMCLLGGMGTFFGPFVGAAAFLYLEDVMTTFTTHWMAAVGIDLHGLRAVLPEGHLGLDPALAAARRDRARRPRGSVVEDTA